MAEHQHINPSTLGPNPGFSALVKAGNTLYIAGQVAKTPDGTLVGPGDAEAQVRQTWKNIESAVQAGGGTLADVVKTTTFVTSMEYISATRKIRSELFPAGNGPPGTIVEVANLATPGVLVEIEAIAVVG